MTDLPEGVRVWLQARNQPLQILEDEVLQEGAPEYHHNGSIVQNDEIFSFLFPAKPRLSNIRLYGT